MRKRSTLKEEIFIEILHALLPDNVTSEVTHER
jgi:hypothetical protein